MPIPMQKPGVMIRDLESFSDFERVQDLEKRVWGLSDLDVLPLTLVLASKAAGSMWLGAFDGPRLIGFAFAFPSTEAGKLRLHSHMLAVDAGFRGQDVGYQLKLAQRERALALRIQDPKSKFPSGLNASAVDQFSSLRIDEMSWTFDPLQGRNAHLNFFKLGAVSDCYKVDFYGPQTSSPLHQTGTDRLWLTWPLASRRVKTRLQGGNHRAEILDAISTVTPLVQFHGTGEPKRADLPIALARQRIVIEVPGDIGEVEHQDSTLAREWRMATRWAFTEAVAAGFVVLEFVRAIRGQQGPSAYLLQKGSLAEHTV